MSSIQFPAPDGSILARRDAIIAGLEGLLPAGTLVTGHAELRAFETDALTAYRRIPLAVALPKTTQQVSAVMA
jgi:glycolate oxidase